MHVAFDVDPVALYTWCLCDDEIEAAQRVFRRRMSDVFVSCYPFLILCGTMRNYIALTLMFIAAQKNFLVLEMSTAKISQIPLVIE